MSEYLATFHTHLSAMITRKNLENIGIECVFAPVPRVLSSSCGTCIKYSAKEDCKESMDRDCEAIYKVIDFEKYEKLVYFG